MTDGNPEGGEPDEADGPGGGPTRVVSSRSVDDILESLEKTDDSSDLEAEADSGADAVDAAATARAGDRTDGQLEADSTAAVDSGTVPQEDDDVSTDDRDDGPAAGSTATDSSPQADDTPSSDPVARAETPTGDGEYNSEPRGSEAAAADETGPDDEAIADHADLALEERVQAGTVTGADVRAAEAGVGRASTPEVDELDLSLDDLENDVSPLDGAPSDDDGLLAGAGVGSQGSTGSGAENGGGPTGTFDGGSTGDQPDGAPSATDADSSEADDEGSAGFLARLKRLISE